MQSAVQPDTSVNSYLESIREAARSVTAVATQIDLALHESRQPMERLVATIARMGLTLSALDATPQGRQDAGLDLAVDLQVDWALSQLRRDFGCAVEELQFHDRMAQHFTHLHDYLVGVSSLLAGIVEREDRGSDPVLEEASHAAWETLRERLFQRLISDAQRQFLQLVLPGGQSERWISNDNIDTRHARPGSIDLF